MKLLILDTFLALVNGVLIAEKIAGGRKLNNKMKKY